MTYFVPYSVKHGNGAIRHYLFHEPSLILARPSVRYALLGRIVGNWLVGAAHSARGWQVVALGWEGPIFVVSVKEVRRG